MKIIEIVRVPELENKFPKPDNYPAIKADIAERGIQEAIVVNPKKELLCGYTRLSIAQELGIDEIVHRTVEITEKSDMLEYAILDNIRRRQLTKLQLVEYGMELEKLYEGRDHRPNKCGQNVHTYEGKTRDLVADKLSKETGEKMSGKTYERWKTIATKAIPEVKELFNDNELTQKDILLLTKETPDIQKQVIEKMRSGESMNKAIKESKNEPVVNPPLPEGIYNVIYADPPWEYSNTIRNWGPAALHYPTMPLDDICNYTDKNGRKVPEMIADDATLFLWVTNPFLQDAFKVVEAWGFCYKTNIVWVKRNLQRPGSGFYVRGRHELLFICTKGSFVPDQTGKEPIGSVIDADVDEHSAKPDKVYELIENMYPTEKYCELFLRGEPRKGWTGHGFEATT